MKSLIIILLAAFTLSVALPTSVEAAKGKKPTASGVAKAGKKAKKAGKKKGKKGGKKAKIGKKAAAAK
jgi:hypothetical protein